MIDEVTGQGLEHCAPWGKKPDPAVPPVFPLLGDIEETMRERTRQLALASAAAAEELRAAEARREALRLPGEGFTPERGGEVLFVGGCADGQLLTVPPQSWAYCVAERDEDTSRFLFRSARAPVIPAPARRSTYRPATLLLAGTRWTCFLSNDLDPEQLFGRLLRGFVSRRTDRDWMRQRGRLPDDGAAC